MAEKQAKQHKETQKRLPVKRGSGGARGQTAEPTLTETVGSRSGLLANTHLSSLQRQELARSIGQARGNQQLRQMLAQAGPTEVQKDEGEMVARGGGNYEVVAGDSLWKIAKTTYGQGKFWQELYKANPDKAARGGNLILIGTLLKLPVLQVPANTAPEVAHANGGDQPAVGPVGKSTEFGTFEIYPDDFTGPLPLSVRNAESWPIKQADFDALNTRLTQVKNNSSKLIITGTDPFKTGVMLDLAWLMTIDVGQDLVKEIQESSHTVNVKQVTGGNETSYNPNADSFEKPVSPPQAGPGANVTIGYNPNTLFISDGTLAWHHRPPAIGLAHEMVHAWTGVYGTRALGTDSAGVNRRELQATGLGEFAAARITENKFRAAFGLPTRPVY